MAQLEDNKLVMYPVLKATVLRKDYKIFVRASGEVALHKLKGNRVLFLVFLGLKYSLAIEE